MQPLIDARISFALNILRMNAIGQNLTKFVYSLTLIRSRLGLLHIIFGKFATELQPLIDVRISFPLNISRMNGQNFTRICIQINMERISVGFI